MWEEDALIEQIKKKREQLKQKRILPNPLPIFGKDCEIPEALRVSFSDGSTAVYDLRIQQPAPQILENIRIIRKWRNT